ncbi:MAG: VWA domain-containing protein [Acidobacteria bacterium]|nr:VWA domain-containing protein [Acidobacteriota bacterium]
MRTGRNQRSAVLAAVLTTLLTGHGLAQPQRVPGAIRVQVTLVPINVIVTDQNDKPVTDLTSDDFVILEDGVRQAVAHFSLQTLVAAAPEQTATRALLRKVPTASLEAQTRRTFVIVLGRGRLQQPSKAVDRLIDFVKGSLLPQDMVAVMGWNRATDFTTDHGQVVQVLERFKKYHEGVEARMALRFSGLAAIYGSKEIPKNLQPDIDRIFVVPGALTARQVPPGNVTDASRIKDDVRQATGGLQRMEADTAGTMSALDQLQVDSLTDLSFDDYVSSQSQTMQDVQNLYTAVEYLRYMDGEKHLLFFTEQGLFLPRLENDKSLAAMANDARVAIDTFQTGGVDASGLPSAATPPPMVGAMGGRGGAGGGQQPRAGNASRLFALSSLRNISMMTGGRASIHGDIGQALSTVDEVTRIEYLLGYYPSKTNWDGKYRNVVVRVRRPGLKVSYRRGYYARESLQPFDRKAFLSYSRIAAAAQYDLEVKDLKVKAKATTVAAASGGQEVQVDLAIDASRVPFKEEDGLHKATLQLTTFYGDARGRFLGDAWQTLDLNLRPATWERVKKEGIVCSTRVPLRVQGQTFKIVVYSYEADLVGSVTTKLKN